MPHRTPQTNATERETALVIDHTAQVFHISSNRRRMVSHLLKLAKAHGLTTDYSPTNGDYSISLSNVPLTLLPRLCLATYSRKIVGSESES